MTKTLTISGTLPNLNDYIAAERSNRYKAAAMKAEAEQLVRWFIISQLRGVQFDSPVKMHYTWVEKNRRRDQDNVSSFGRKVIQDALVKAGVLKDDGWDEISGFSDTFAVDKYEPRIVVVITDEE